jgi:predicted transcriptional regulator
MAKKGARTGLGARERQIMDIVFELGEASVGDVHGRLADPPSYSSVRTMIRLLESKGFLRHRREGTKYVYRSTQSKMVVRKSAMQDLLRTFYGGSAPDAVAAILDSEKLSKEDLSRIEKLIDDARKEGR